MVPVSGASFFVNAMDTKTRGVDVVGKQRLSLKQYGNLELGIGYNYGVTKITSVKDSSGQLAGSGLELIGRVARGPSEPGRQTQVVIRPVSAYRCLAGRIDITPAGSAQFRPGLIRIGIKQIVHTEGQAGLPAGWNLPALPFWTSRASRRD